MTHITRSAVITKVIATIAAGLVAISLAACSTGSADSAQSTAACAEMQDYPVTAASQEVVIALDATASARDGSWLGPHFDALVTQAAGVYSTLSVLWIGGANEAPTWAIDNLPLNNVDYPFGTMKYTEQVERAASCVAEMVGAPATNQPGTDLGTAIQVGADRLAEGTGAKKLIVISDGLSNTGPINLTGRIGTTSVDLAVAELDRVGFLPSLTGVDVTFAALGVTAGAVIQGPNVTWLRNYYAAVCERGSAAACSAPIADQGATTGGTAPRPDAPEDPDLTLSSMQFEFGDAEVRFEGDSDVISTAADGALSQVAACLRDGGELTVIGHSANTGDPAGEHAMSERRARNVATRILQLAGNPTVTVTVIGVGATEPKSSTGDEAEDRRVTVSLTGVCS